MLVNVFLLCGAVGGTVMVAQLLVGLAGLAGHGDGGHDAADAQGGHALGAGEGGHGAGGAPTAHGAHAAHGPPWLGLLNLRALTTALCFFGLGGLSSMAGGLGAGLSVIFGLSAAAGGAALVATLQRTLGRLRADGTLRLEEAVGRGATVYLGIPAGGAGAGKVTLTLQGRTVECEAVTSQGELPTGSRVLVVDVVAPGRLAVEPDPLPPEPRESKET